jgi:hypothetical protein
MLRSVMQTEQIVALLIAERDRLSRAIGELQGSAKRHSPPRASSLALRAPAAKPAARKRRISAAGRKAIADAARRRWAAVKAAKNKDTSK